MPLARFASILLLLRARAVFATEQAPLRCCYEPIAAKPWTLPDEAGLNAVLLKCVEKVLGERYLESEVLLKTHTTWSAKITKAPIPYAVLPIYLFVGTGVYERDPKRIEAIWATIATIRKSPANATADTPLSASARWLRPLARPGSCRQPSRQS